MKPKERFFFYDDDLCYGCYELDHFLEESKERDKPFKISGAKIIYGDDSFYCDEFGESGLTSEADCGSFCKHYKPRNGKSGRCKHHKNCYEPNGNIYTVSNGSVSQSKEGKTI